MYSKIQGPGYYLGEGGSGRVLDGLEESKSVQVGPRGSEKGLSGAVKGKERPRGAGRVKDDPGHFVRVREGPGKSKRVREGLEGSRRVQEIPLSSIRVQEGHITVTLVPFRSHQPYLFISHI